MLDTPIIKKYVIVGMLYNLMLRAQRCITFQLGVLLQTKDDSGIYTSNCFTNSAIETRSIRF